MTKPRPAEFKWRQFEPQVILMAVGWYLRFSLSYRDVEELVRERGLSVDHVTVWRWVQRYAPEIERRLRPHLKPTNKNWRVDENVHPRQRQVDLFVPCRGLYRRQHRFSTVRPAGCSRRQAVLSKGIEFSEPPHAAGDQCG